jgi:phosphatidylglycerol---prolipoprotein diacylglyceryl transferase
MTIFTFHIWWITLAPTWYGLMYAVSFFIALILIRKKFSEKETDTLFFATVLGVILGGRLGYVLFYNLGYFLENPSEIFMVWKGGMSFHGWALGVILAWYIAARKIGKSFLYVADSLVWIVPIGLFFWRIWNYINGELMGLPGYTWWLARSIDGTTYFPTPLLEALLEWIILLVILIWKKKNIAYSGQVWVWFLGGYGMMRFFAEFLRTPDVQIGYIFGWWMTLGHIFSLCMLFAALILSKVLRKSK